MSENTSTGELDIKQELFHEMTELGIMAHGLESLSKSYLNSEDYGGYTVLSGIYKAMTERVNNLESLICKLPGGLR
ncbi:hypothetical protein [Desulfonatronovibrio magnus]|uniref:hypothetical protein n=1 Tax=Desulfonatronovibrio magnus TaxID=698827 RepID=UPI0005EAE98D|nr:hypothetical protein [Desulfonatronovibrio magnus]